MTNYFLEKPLLLLDLDETLIHTEIKKPEGDTAQENKPNKVHTFFIFNKINPGFRTK